MRTHRKGLSPANKALSRAHEYLISNGYSAPSWEPSKARKQGQYGARLAVLHKLEQVAGIQLSAFFSVARTKRVLKMLSGGFIKHGNQRNAQADDNKKFYASYEWRKVRYTVLKKHGRVCMLCGSSNGAMHVDHIKPLRFFPDLRLNEYNLQVLCAACNHGKGNWDMTDWRPTNQPQPRIRKIVKCS